MELPLIELVSLSASSLGLIHNSAKKINETESERLCFTNNTSRPEDERQSL